MIPAPTAQFEIEEARQRGGVPVFRFTFFPQAYLTGVAAGSGTYTDCQYVDPGRIQVDNAVLSASWVGPAEQPRTERFPVAATVAWTLNHGVMSLTAFYRTAATTEALAAASWVAMSNGGTFNLQQYYQLKFVWAGYRGYASPVEDLVDPAAAFAEPAPGDPFESYASPGPGGPAYVEAVTLTGEYGLVAGDIKNAGTVSLENRPDFSEIVAGEHTLQLFDPDGKFDPAQADFIFADESEAGIEGWEGKKVRFEYGFQRPGSILADYVTRYEGEILGWNTYPAEVSGDGKPAEMPYAEIYSNDLINRLLVQPVATATEDGSADPLVYGAGVREAQQVSSRNPFVLIRSADFETGDLSQVEAAVANGGTVTISSTDPLRGVYSAETSITGVNGQAFIKLALDRPSSAIFASGWFKIREMPAEPAVDSSRPLLELYDAAGSPFFYLYTGSEGRIYAALPGYGLKESSAYLGSYAGRTQLCIGLLVGNPGLIKIWLNDSEILNWDDINTANVAPLGCKWGSENRTIAEIWRIAWDNLELRNLWEPMMYRVPGGAVLAITEMYTDGRTILKKTTPGTSRPVINPPFGISFAYTQGTQLSSTNFTALPELGCVVWSDWRNPPEGSIFLRIQKDLTYHPVDVLTALLTAWGLAERIDVASFAQAKAATPEYGIPVLYYFEADTVRAEAVKEICCRFFLSFFMDQGLIKLQAWVAAGPGAPVRTLLPASIRSKPVRRLLTDLTPRVTVKCGWADKNPDLQYTAQNQDLLDRLGDSSGVELDFSWGQPVSLEDLDLSRSQADRLLARLQARRQEPEISGWLELARLEIAADAVALDGQTYEVSGVTLRAGDDPPGCDVKLLRFPGVE